MWKNKKNIINFLLVVAVVAMGAIILENQGRLTVPSWPMKNLAYLQQFHSENPYSSILLFCLMHLLSSSLSIPGSCTLLNITSGAVFGFFRGSIIVYVITFLSACAGYFIGRMLPLENIKRKYSSQFEQIQVKFEQYDYLSLVLVRLSPFLPFGLLNIILGFIKIPFLTYIISTTVGVFFDVVLLNSIGALISGQKASGWQDKQSILTIFIILVVAAYLVKNLSKNKQDQQP